MRLTILALGTQGDVLPYVALGLGLQAAGHDVVLATHANFEPLVRSRGLGYRRIASDPQALLSSDIGKMLLRSSRNFIAFTGSFIEALEPIAQQILDDLWAASRDADAMFYSSLGLTAYHVARERGIPAHAAFLQPLTRTCCWPAMWVPTKFALGQTGNWLSHLVTEQVFWQAARPLINRWRRGNHLGRAPVWGYYDDIYRPPAGIFYGFSPAVVPKPPDWGDGVHVTGYWFLDRPADWRPAPELLDFLSAGPPPVYIGFGSMQSFDIERRLNVALEALARAGRRGIVVTGWSGVSRSDLPDDVFKTDWVPHDWLFPRVALAIHHGGAGTTAAALRAGIPSIVMPFFFDQYFWAQRLAALGAGAHSRPDHHSAVEALAAAIRKALLNPGMRQRAEALGRRLQQEDGVGQAVRVFQNSLNGNGRH